MAVPIINPNTSVLGYDQWQTFQYQPYATNSPTGWSCAGLPPGVAIDGTTGLISGFAQMPGVWVCPLIATNGTGDSAAVILTFGIDAAAFTPTVATTLLIDLDTGHVTSADGSRSSAASSAGPLLWMKENDTAALLLRFYNAGTYVDQTLSSLKFGVKQFEPDGLIELGGGASLGSDFVKYGIDDNSYFVLIADFNSDDLAAALTDYEADAGTFFYALAEIEWKTANPFTGLSPDPLIRTTRTFLVGIERDLVPN